MTNLTYKSLIDAGAPALPMGWSYMVNVDVAATLSVSVLNPTGTVKGLVGTNAMYITPENQLALIIKTCQKAFEDYEKNTTVKNSLDTLISHAGTYTNV